MTKKAAALLLAASLAVSVCATPVFAADPATTPTTPNMGSQLRKNTDAPGNSGIVTGSTNVYYNVTESYAWSVPATIDFGEDAGVKNTSTVNATLNEDGPGEKAKQDTTDNKWKGTAPKVVVSKNVIGVGKTLKIYVATDDKGYTTSFDTAKNQFYVTSGTEDLYFSITKTAAGQTAKELNTKDNVVMSVPSGTNKGEQTLEFKLETTTKDTAEKAGKYEGHVVFYSKLV